MYKDKPVVLATKHQKEDVIRPVLEKGLGVLFMSLCNLNVASEVFHSIHTAVINC